MKILYLAIAALLLNLTAFAQTAANPASATDDPPVVNYSFKSTDQNYLKFDKLMPFDKAFTIHFTEIPATISYIQVKVLRFNTDNINTKKGGTFTLDNLKPGTFEFDLAKWNRPAGDNTVLTADISEIIRLLPNTDYQVSIETGTERPLTADEQNALLNALLQNSAITGSVQVLAQSILSTQLTPPAIISQDKAAIVSLITQGVAQVNPKYKFKAPDDLKITAEVRDLNDALRIVLFNAADLKQAVSAAALPQLKTATDRVMSTNYGTVTDAEVAALTTLFQGIVTADAALNNANHGMVVAYTRNITNALPEIKAASKALYNLFVNGVTLPNTNFSDMSAPTYSSDFLKSAQLYVTLDLGYAYVSRIDRGLAYSGVNIYLRPIDKGVPLNHYSGWNSFGVRTSILVGLSLGSVAEANVRKGLIGDQALVLGLGYRIVSFFKFNAGCFVHYRYDQDPVITPNRYYTSLSPFVSFSVDLDAKSLFSGIGTSLLK